MFRDAESILCGWNSQSGGCEFGLIWLVLLAERLEIIWEEGGEEDENFEFFCVGLCRLSWNVLIVLHCTAAMMWQVHSSCWPQRQR